MTEIDVLKAQVVHFKKVVNDLMAQIDSYELQERSLKKWLDENPNESDQLTRLMNENALLRAELLKYRVKRLR
jgi:hypothetical protein